MKILKKTTTLIFFILFSGNYVLSQPQTLDKIIAIVNNNIILESDIQKMQNIIEFNKKYINHKKIFPFYNFRQHIINSLIIKNIMLDHANNHKINIDQSAKNNIFLNFIYQNKLSPQKFFTLLHKNNIDHKTYTKYLMQKNIINQLKNKIISHKKNIFPEEIKTFIQNIPIQKNDKINIDYLYISPYINNNIFYNKKHSNNIVITKIIANTIYFMINNDPIYYNKILNTFNLNKNNILNIKTGNLLIDKNNLQNIPFQCNINLIKNNKKNTILGPYEESKNSIKGFYIIKINENKKNNNEKTKYIIPEIYIRHILLYNNTNNDKNHDKKILNKINEISNIINNKHNNTTIIPKKIINPYINDTPILIKEKFYWNCIYNYTSPLQNILKQLKLFEVSIPFKSHEGWNIIQIIDTRSIYISNNNIKKYSYDLLKKQKTYNTLNKWLNQKLNTAYLKIYNT